MKADMVLTMEFCVDEQQKLISEINHLTSLDAPSQYEIGSKTCLMEELLGVECFLKRAEKAFQQVKGALPKISYNILDAQGVYDPLKSLSDTDLEDLEQMLNEYSEQNTSSDTECNDSGSDDSGTE